MEKPIFIVFSVIVAIMSSSGESTLSNRALFAVDLFQNIASENANENVVISPASIDNCLSLVYFGSNGVTATELESGLRLGSSNKQSVAKFFEDLFNNTKATENSMLVIANKIYANIGKEIQPDFKDVAEKSFKSEIENIDFGQNEKAVNTINSWVEEKTNNKIKNLLSKDTVDSSTSIILVNAIYFKGKWQLPFSQVSTTKSQFWKSQTESIQVDTMLGDEVFLYGQFSDLDATAIEMPYKDSDISMMILLPNKRDGLKDFELKLKNVDLLSFSNDMTKREVEVFLPKFQAEFSVKLNDHLKNMGIQSIFSDSSDLSGIFSDKGKYKVSEVYQKAFIDVNEAGSEAAAATFLKIVPMSLNFDKKQFKADHPFVFIIKDKRAIYFAGHVTF